MSLDGYLGHKNRLRSARGFTLVEVLVSLGIVSVALLAGIRATDNLANNSQRLVDVLLGQICACLLYTSPSPRDRTRSRMPSSA